eukprot:g15116.t1
MDRTDGEEDALGPLGECTAEVLGYLQQTLTERQFVRLLGEASAVAAETGDNVTFGRLLDAGAASCDSFRSRGSKHTMLGCAASGGSAEIVERLLRDEGGQGMHQLNVASGLKRNTPVYVAVEANAPEVVKVLLQRGADPNIPSDSDGGKSPLHEAVSRGHRACARSLLHTNSTIELNVNARQSRGQTALHQAVSLGRVDMVQDLLGCGANPSLTPYPTELRNRDGLNPELGMPTCLCLAASEGNATMVETLIDHAATSIEARERIFASSGMGATAMHFAAQGSGHGPPTDNSSVVHALAQQQQVDVNAILYEGRQTALHVACSTQSTCTATVRALLAVGSEINAVDCVGNTALHVACHGSPPSVVQLLLLHGADDTARNNGAKTPADMDGSARPSIQRLLAAHRTWRRRGWLVLCRARTTKNVSLAGEGAAAGMSQEQARNKKGRASEEGESEGGIDAKGDGDGQGEMDGFAQLVDDVISCAEEGVFRHVVAFL